MSIIRSGLLAVLVVLTSGLSASAQTTAISTDPLSSWNDGKAKQAILDFVRNTTDAASTSYVLPEDRIATFDQDGTLWVEHPMYTQVVYSLERVPALVAAKPELKNVEVLAGEGGRLGTLRVESKRVLLRGDLFRTTLQIGEALAVLRKLLQ